MPAGRFNGCSRAAFERENDLADFYLLSLFDFYIAHHAADAGWNFYDGLFGFVFHHRLPFGDARARRDHEAHELAAVDVLAKFRKFEFAGAVTARSCSATGGPGATRRRRN